MEAVNEAGLKSAQDQASLRSGGASVGEKQAELSRLPSHRKEGISYGKPQTLVGIVEVAMHLEKGGAVAAIDIRAQGQRGPERIRERPE